MTNYSLTDLVELERLQQIQDLFAEANGIASTITALDGTPITEPSNHSTICTLIRQTRHGKKKCIASGRLLGQEASQRLQPFYKKCRSCGFSDAAAPIIVDGNHLANWIIGQYHIQDVDEGRVRQYAREIGADEEKMTAAFYDMETIPTERFEKILHFLWVMANEISNMGFINLKRQQQTIELEKVQAELQKQHTHLEMMVEERTKDLVRLNTELQDEISAKNKLRRMQHRLIAAIENVDESIIITNTVPEILYVNPAFEKISGYSHDEVMGKNPSILSSGVHDEAFYKELWDTILSGETWKGRFTNTSKKGEIYYVEATISSVKDDKGRILNFVSIKRDITTQLEMERQILQMSKMEAIGTLAAGIAHEINTPIQYVTDNTHFLEDAFSDYQQLLRKYTALKQSDSDNEQFASLSKQIDAFEKEIDLDYLNGETGKAIEGSLEGLNRMATVVRAMKDFAHPGGKTKEEVDINEIINNTVTVATNEWKYCADITLNLNDSLPLVPVYSGQIKQAILNVVVNAAHAINESQLQEKGTITISTSQSGDSIKIEISDNGMGIPEEVLGHIFDPFFTTKTVGKGTGQGLAMVHSTLVDGHGGSINVTSKHGKGSTFTLSLPIPPAETDTNTSC
ncbi:MAG TPA: PocR ligand-binding domain-containing protein [Desulfopila sp.]|nr:PocR ligand-binding domain-containing protein [Desulfopila sp.]